MAHSIALVGLGKIGMLYDLELPENDYVLSHARAFILHQDFELIGAVDPAVELREIFFKIYNTVAYPSVEELLSHVSPDIVVIGSPTNTHKKIIEEVLKKTRPKVILCEKPLAYGSADARDIVEQCQEKDVQLFVNYIRRADPAVLEVKSRLTSGQIAPPYKAIVWYSKGLLHNGSHFLDLMSFWFGPVKAMSMIDPGRTINEQDAEPDFRVEFETASAIFCSANEENFSHYTIEVVASNGRLRYETGGVVLWQASGPHPTLENYNQLQAKTEVIENDMNHYQYHVAEQLSRAMKNTEHTLCTGESGVMNIQMLESLINEQVSH